MFARILVPLDGSELAERALAYATALSVPTAAHLALVRIVPLARATAEAEAYLAEVATRLTGRGVPVEVGCRHGRSVASRIVREVGVRHADLIAMTTHGRTGPGRWLFGSVAERVIASSPVPVLVDRGWLPRSRELLLEDGPRVLVTLDGSSFAETALGVAAGLADDVGGQLTLVHVAPPPESALPGDYASLPEMQIQQQAEWRHASALEYLDAVADRVALFRPGLEVRVDVRLGHAADEIAAAALATDAALVVMATHGRTGLLRSMVGSVAGAVLQYGATPLVLVHPASLADRFKLPERASVAAQ
jgi:nucleotide-binding universal stress UspA family protein